MRCARGSTKDKTPRFEFSEPAFRERSEEKPLVNLVDSVQFVSRNTAELRGIFTGVIAFESPHKTPQVCASNRASPVGHWKVPKVMTQPYHLTYAVSAVAAAWRNQVAFEYDGPGCGGKFSHAWIGANNQQIKSKSDAHPHPSTT
ncbi:hypothetical protein CHU98_g8091 [Xylaria longipes]|nr:hypothetical protein CHU98_g8091 [Xylaria longipes]